MERTSGRLRRKTGNRITDDTPDHGSNAMTEATSEHHKNDIVVHHSTEKTNGRWRPMELVKGASNVFFKQDHVSPRKRKGTAINVPSGDDLSESR